MTLHFYYHPRWCSSNNQSVRSSVLVVSRSLWPGNRTIVEVASMAATWWIVALVNFERLWCSQETPHHFSDIHLTLCSTLGLDKRRICQNKASHKMANSAWLYWFYSKKEMAALWNARIHIYWPFLEIWFILYYYFTIFIDNLSENNFHNEKQQL